MWRALFSSFDSHEEASHVETSLHGKAVHEVEVGHSSPLPPPSPISNRPDDAADDFALSPDRFVAKNDKGTTRNSNVASPDVGKDHHTVVVSPPPAVSSWKSGLPVRPPSDDEGGDDDEWNGGFIFSKSDF